MYQNNVQCEFGSFRDPSGYVFFFQDSIYRTLDSASFSLVQQLEREGILGDLATQGYLIPTKVISQANPLYRTLKEHLPHEQHFLHHEKIPLISYPYEWSFSMLNDAAKLQLELQLTLLEKGYSLKDASAFNVQFVHCRPVFIDIPSIEKPRRKDVWIAYGQFCQMYLFPLLLKRYRHISTKGYFLNSINGLSVEEVYHIFGTWGSLKPALLIDVLLQYHFQKSSSHKTSALKQKLSQGESSTTSQVINLTRVLKKIEKISSERKPTGHWIDYINKSTYSIEAETEKVNYIKEFLKKHSPHTVLDLGCNTGRYSLLASEAGAKVIAIDSDHDSVDLLYQHAKREQASVLPLWVDIANPSPALGFRNQERKSFMERMKCDALLALALIHHLLITSRIPLEAICELFYDLTTSYVVVEFIEREDEMFQTLLALREDIYGHITRDLFLATFGKKFDLISQYNLSNTKRTLFTFKKK